MSVNINVGDVLEFTHCSFVTDQVALNKTHWVAIAVVGTISDQNVANSADAVFAPPMKAFLATDANYRGTGVQRILPLPKAPQVSAIAAAAAGLAAPPTLPRQVAGVISLKTAKAGRAFRGRFYQAFPAASFNTAAGQPFPAYSVQMLILAAALSAQLNVVSGLNSAQIVPVIFHRKTGTYDLVTSAAFPRNVWGTQRRRGSYGRTNVVPF
jgi:hypothetical protein